jgi:GAF domain-containing protein
MAKLDDTLLDETTPLAESRELQDSSFLDQAHVLHEFGKSFVKCDNAQDAIEKLVEFRDFQDNSSLKQINTLREFGNSLFQCDSVEEIFEKVRIEISRVLKPQLISLFLFSKESYIERFGTWGVDKNHHEIRGADWFKDEKYEPGESFSGKTILAPNNSSDLKGRNSYGRSQNADFSDTDPIDLKYGKPYAEILGFLKCSVSVPLNGMQKTFGTLEVINCLSRDNDLPDPSITFSEHDTYWLTVLGAHVANAISRLRRTWEENILLETSRRLADLEYDRPPNLSIHDWITHELVDYKYMPYKACIIRLTYDQLSLSVVAKDCTKDIDWQGRLDDNRTKGQGLAGRVFESGQYIAIEDISKRKEEFLNHTWIENQGLQSFICYPLAVQGEVLGTISLFCGYRHRFSNSDQSLLQSISFLLATFKKLREFQKLEQEELDEVLSQAHIIDEDKIISCLKNSKYDFRTVEGISAETGIQADKVQTFLQSSSMVRTSLARNKRGMTLYAHRDRPIKLQEVLSISQDFLGRYFL